MSRHRSARPRYGRILLAMTALTVTSVAVLGGVGVIATAPSSAEGDGPAAAILPAGGHREAAATEPQIRTVTQGPSVPAEPEPDPESLPTDAGKGRRIIFSETEQRVWLVRANDTVRRSYLVSGSLVDNLDPGRYAVYSKSRYAVGVDDSGVMEFFVRFAHGEQAAIGFHTIPTKLGSALQSRADLGSPQSHGCIRQAEADAISLWKFAPEGTTVVVI